MKIAMITGPSSGIGRATAIEMGSLGFHIVAAGRSRDRTMPVVDEIRRSGGSSEFLHIDLASLDSTQAAAREFEAGDRPLDVLINNAGVGVARGTTDDGFEIHFGVNHLGHFMLTQELGRSLVAGARIVQVTSAAHFNARDIDFARVEGRTRSILGWNEYGTSKLANVLFVRELARRRPNWRAYAVHPGMTDTAMFPRWARPFIRRRLRTPQQGAQTVIWCATSAEVEDESGLYYRNMESRPPSEAAQDDEMARELWERSERWCHIARQR